MKALLFALALSSAAVLAEDDGKLTIDIPSAVQATIVKEKGDAGKIVDFKKVNETDGTTYVIGILLDARRYSLSLDAAGRVMRKQLDEEHDGPKHVRVDGLPEKVRKTMQREAGAARIDEIEVQEAKTVYITEVVMGKRRYRIEVAVDGMLIGKEYIGDDEGN